MEKIKAKKAEVLKALKTNRAKHIAEYKEALKGYRVKCAKLLEKELTKIEAGKKFNMYFSVNEPQSYEKDYNLAIEMLEMDINDTVELTRNEFSNYIKDDWNWKNSFSVTNSGYVGIGTTGPSGTSGTVGYSGYGGAARTVKFSKEELT